MLAMLAYELYTFNKTKGYELIGALPERGKNLARITPNSVINWGKMLLGGNVDSNDIFFKPIYLSSNNYQKLSQSSVVKREKRLPLKRPFPEGRVCAHIVLD